MHTSHSSPFNLLCNRVMKYLVIMGQWNCKKLCIKDVLCKICLPVSEQLLLIFFKCHACLMRNSHYIDFKMFQTESFFFSNQRLDGKQDYFFLTLIQSKTLIHTAEVHFWGQQVPQNHFHFSSKICFIIITVYLQCAIYNYLYINIYIYIYIWI